MKRLFTLRKVGGGNLPEEFENKMAAKKRRKEINPKREDGTEIMEYVVTYGPDHDRYTGT